MAPAKPYPDRKKAEHPDIIVIGGGPAGLMAAGRAGELGARVTLIEKNQRLGLKLLITGGGRCNVTNSAGTREFVAAFGRNGKFLYRALSVFSPANLIGFLHKRGVPVRTDPDGKVFPADDKAQSVLDALSGYLRHGGVRVINASAAAGLLRGEGGRVEGVQLADGSAVRAPKVIVATGGLSYPATGSTGDGYAWAKACGHSVTPLRPGLTALESDAPFIKDLQGLALQNAELSVLVNGRRAGGGRGDLVFTHFGVSGPRLLLLSGLAVDALAVAGNKVELALNLLPGLGAAEAGAAIQKYFSANGAKMLASYLKEALPASLAPVVESLCGIARDKKCAAISAAERGRLAALLCDFRLRITRPRPLAEATVTRGGVSLGEVNPQTLESRLAPGLYFCGEVLDLDGLTGGYNLQEAFSTGYLAGQSAAARAD